MGITYVGGQVGGRAGSTSTSNITYALTGGTDPVPRRGDFIIITVVVASQGRNPACAITVPSTYGAWSQLAQLNASAVTYDTSLRVSYKFQAETLDTTFQLPSTGDIADAQRYTVQVWRGVDPSNPQDVAAVSATGTGTGRPNPGSITPTTSGAYVLICGGGAASAGASYTAPANYTTNFLTGFTADTNDAMVGSGYRAWTSGAEDPAAYTGGTTGANDSWCAYTIALRPEVGGTLRSIEVGNPHNTNQLILSTTFPDISVGVLFTAWCKAPTPPAYPYSHGNRYPWGLGGTDWNIICIGNNMATSVTDASSASINHNITLWGTGGDSLGILHELAAEAPLIDWTFVAWQFIMNGTDGFVMRQWIKVGAAAPFIIREFTMTLAETRTRVGDGAFNFSAITSMGIGGHAILGGDPEPYNMTRVRIYERNTRPTESELSAIAFNDGYDTSAWADYPLTWQDGAGDFTDHSGNSRPTLTQSGTVVGGHPIATVPYSDVGKIVALQSPMHQIENSTGTPMTITFETLPTAGNLITVEGGMTGGTPAVVDSEANNLTVVYSSPSNGYRPFIAYIVMPSGATAPYSVEVSGYTSSHIARARAYEWDNVDATPLDWSKTSTSLADPLTITADSADTLDGTLVISSFMADASWSDWPIVPPAGWLMTAASATTEGTDNVGPPTQDISNGGQSIHRIFPTAATESITYPTQPTAGSITAVMAGFKPSAASSGITGTASITLATLITASAGNLPIAGAESSTLGALTLSATGTLPIVGTAGTTLGDVTLVAASTIGSTPIAGTASITLDALTVSSQGDLPIGGQVSIVLGILTAAGVADLPIRGQTGITLGALTGAGASDLPITAQASITLGALTLASTSTLSDPDTITGTASITLDALTVGAVANLPIAASAAVTLGTLTGAGASDLPITGQSSITLGALTLASTGAFADPDTITALAGITLGDLTVSSQGNLPIGGQVSIVLGILTATPVADLPIVGQASITLGALTLVASETLYIIAGMTFTQTRREAEFTLATRTATFTRDF